MLNKGQYLVLATSTDIGKTFFVTEICKKLIKNNFSVGAVKPVISGFDEEDQNSDVAKILSALNKDFSKKNIEEISFSRFKAPLSPALAAKKENQEINFLELKNFCQDKINEAKNFDYFFIEGAGGVMTPITYQKTFLDLAESLKLPVILIGGNYLGSISDILCAVEALKSRNIKVEVIVINDFVTRNNPVDLDENIEQIRSLTSLEVNKINFLL